VLSTEHAGQRAKYKDAKRLQFLGPSTNFGGSERSESEVGTGLQWEGEGTIGSGF